MHDSSDGLPLRKRWKPVVHSTPLACPWHVVVLLGWLGLLCSGCHGDKPEQREPAIPRPTAAPVASPGVDSCAECHADETKRWQGSAHRRAARDSRDAGQPLHADWSAPASLATAPVMLATPSMTVAPSMTLADADGAEAPRTVVLAVGGRRREDFVTLHGQRLQVLPLSWSVVRKRFVAPFVEDMGLDAEPDTAWHWTGRRRDFGLSCSRCHPVAASEGEAALPGLSCESCHPGSGAHAADARLARAERRDTPDASGLSAHDALAACGRCHASGETMPRGGDYSLTGEIFPALLATVLGPNTSYYPDGRPGSAHGYEVQALVQSRCFKEGGVTCLTCHDPHGGAEGGSSLKVLDPDASCHSCHEEIAATARSHAHHVVASEPVPLASAEPQGPRADRAPGCVDCHAPALIPFDREGFARDHAIGVPEPENMAGHGIPDACSSCHPNRKPADLARWLDARFPDRSDARRRLAKAFSSAAHGGPTTAHELVAVLGDDEFDAWTRASASTLLGSLGTSASTMAGPVLLQVFETETDPVLVSAAARAYGSVGGQDVEALARLVERRRTDDWRVALAAASALDQIGNARGPLELERLAGNTQLPPAAGDEIDFDLALSLIRRGAPKRAQALLLDLSRRQPERAAVWLNLGVACVGIDDAEGARRAWREVLSLVPGDPHATANLKSLDTR